MRSICFGVRGLAPLLPYDKYQVAYSIKHHTTQHYLGDNKSLGVTGLGLFYQLFSSKNDPTLKRRFSPNHGPRIWRPTGNPLILPHLIESPQTPAKLAVTVKISAAYISKGSEVFSP